MCVHLSKFHQPRHTKNDRDFRILSSVLLYVVNKGEEIRFAWEENFQGAFKMRSFNATDVTKAEDLYDANRQFSLFNYSSRMNFQQDENRRLRRFIATKFHFVLFIPNTTYKTPVCFPSLPGR